MVATPNPDRRVVREISPSSAARVALGLSLTFSAILFVGLVALWALAAISGALGSIEGFIEDLGFAGFSISFFAFVPVFVLLALVWCGVMAAVGAATATLYNTLSELIGGLEVRMRGR